MRRLLLALPLLVFATVGGVAYVMLDATSSGRRDASSIGFSMTGKPMPAVAMPRHRAAGTVSVGGADGQAYAVNVFASWCAPCRLEATSIEALAGDIPVIGVNYRDNAADADAFLERFGNPYTDIGRDADGSASVRLGVHGLPETFIVGPDGVVVHHHQGPVLADALRGPVGAAVREATGGP